MATYGLAAALAAKGRNGDDTLVHMTGDEVRSLARLGPVTLNPETGLPEAFGLKDIIPMVAGVGGTMVGGPWLGAALAGGTSALINKNPLAGIRDALLTFAGGQLLSGLSGPASAAAEAAGDIGMQAADVAAQEAAAATFPSADYAGGFDAMTGAPLEGAATQMPPMQGMDLPVGYASPGAPMGHTISQWGEGAMSPGESFSRMGDQFGRAASNVMANPSLLPETLTSKGVAVPGIAGLLAGAAIPNMSGTPLPVAPGRTTTLGGVHSIAARPLDRTFQYPSDPYAPATQGRYGSFAEGGPVKRYATGGEIGGIVGTVAGVPLGIPGLGIVGSALGTAADTAEVNTALGSQGLNAVGVPGYLDALTNNLSFGLLGANLATAAMDANDPGVAGPARGEAAAAVQATLDALAEVSPNAPNPGLVAVTPLDDGSALVNAAALTAEAAANDAAIADAASIAAGMDSSAFGGPGVGANADAASISAAMDSSAFGGSVGPSGDPSGDPGIRGGGRIGLRGVIKKAKGGKVPSGMRKRRPAAGMMVPPDYMMLAGGGAIIGAGGGLDDLIQTDISGVTPARLSDGEFVIPADVVSAMGDGSTKAGSEVLYDMIKNIRRHKYGRDKQPPSLKSGLSRLMS